MSNGVYEDGTYLQNNPDWHVQDSAWKAAHIGTLLSRNHIAPKTVCEIGCGAGAVLENLAKRLGADCHLIGYEISPQAFAVCKERASERLQFRSGSLFDSDQSGFDVVMAIDVFEHVPDYMGFLASMKTRGKHHVFHIPLDLSAQAVLRGTPILRSRQTIGHLHYFTKETALAVLRDTGYEVVDFFFTAAAIDLPSMGWKAALAKLPRKLAFAMNQDLAARALGGYSLMVLAR